MATDERKLTDEDRRTIRVVMDRLVPPVDDLPGAGSMGLVENVERMAEEHGRYRRSLARVIDALSWTTSAAAKGGFLGLDGDGQDEAIRRIERSMPVEFANVLEAVYTAYYSRPEVHARIGWRTGPLQPAGFALPPFNESILDTVRQRKPSWRPAPE